MRAVVPRLVRAAGAVAAAAALASAPMTAPARATTYPLTVLSCGQPVTFATAPRRAVIDDIDMAEMAFALKLQPSIVGLVGISGFYHVDAGFRSAAGAIPELAPRYPSLEQILLARADVFIAGWNYGMRIGGPVTPATLAREGVPTLVLSESCVHAGASNGPASMDLLFDDELRLGRVFDREAQAERLVAGWKARLAAVADRVRGLKRPRVFVYDSGADKPFTAGRAALATAMIEAAGGRNVLDDMPTNWGTSSWETVAARDPQFLVLLDYPARDGGGDAGWRTLFDTLRADPAMRVTTAVRGRRLLPLRYEQLTPGPEDIGAVEALARALHPEAFAR